MQLLEQLASGYSEVTESDILTECASIMGYLECMNDILANSILTESVVMEGIDLKAIGKKAIQVIRGLLKKVGDMFRSLGTFIRTKAQQIKQKLSKGKRENSESGNKGSDAGEKQQKENPSRDEKDSDDSKKESKTSDQGSTKTTPQQSSTSSKDTGTHKPDNISTNKSSTAALPQKSDKELLNDIVKGTTYPAPYPGCTNFAFITICTIYRQIIGNYRGLARMPIKAMYECFVEENHKNSKRLFDDEDMKMTDGEIGEYLFGVDDRSSIKGLLKSPADAKKIPNAIYDSKIKTFGESPEMESYKKYVNYRDEFQTAQQNFVIFSGELDKVITNVSSTIKECEDELSMVEKKLDNVDGSDPNISKMIATAHRMCKVTSAYVCNVAMGLSDFYNRISKDLDAGSAYFAKMDAKIKAAGL